jgi:hypothetical protein
LATTQRRPESGDDLQRIRFKLPTLFADVTSGILTLAAVMAASDGPQKNENEHVAN